MYGGDNCDPRRLVTVKAPNGEKRDVPIDPVSVAKQLNFLYGY
jgi:hypothetical protein